MPSILLHYSILQALLELHKRDLPERELTTISSSRLYVVKKQTVVCIRGGAWRRE